MAEEVEYLTEWPPGEEEEPSVVRKRKTERDETGFTKKSRRHCTPSTALAQSEGDCQLDTEEEELLSSAPSIPITTLLARWWKMRLRKDSYIQDKYRTLPPSSHNPNTLLHHIAKLPEAKSFLSNRAQHLQAFLADMSHHALSTTYYCLGDYRTALTHAKLALEEDPTNQEFAWHMELVTRQNNVAKRAEDAMRRLDVHTQLKMPQPTEVVRRSANDLNFKEFFVTYALTHTPVVITDMVDKMMLNPWTLDYLKQVVGGKTAPLKQYVPGSVEWAKLEPAGESTVSQFIDSLAKHKTDEVRYLFDWSLPLHCPELARELTIPSYFAGDFLQRTSPGTLYRDSWPSLFIAPAGITSELHVDAFASNFWMALFQGKKRWVFFPPEDVPLLYPSYVHSTDAVFEATLSAPDLSRHPLLSLTHPRECLLSPGELLFVPSGCPHRVENIEPSLAISANFVDLSNFDGVLSELRVNALRDERASTLLNTLQDPAFDCSMDSEQMSLSWEQFKTWPRPLSNPFTDVKSLVH